MNKNLENIFKSEQYDKFVNQYSYIFNNKYKKATIKKDLNHNFYAFTTTYIHTFFESENISKFIECSSTIIYDNEDNEIFFYKAFDGKAFIDIICHSSGQKYLICTTNFRSYTFFDLSLYKSFSYFPKCEIDNDDDNYLSIYFSSINNIFYNPKNNMLAVNGLDFMDSPTTYLFNFYNPNTLPLPYVDLYHICDDISANNNGSKFLRWNEDNSFLLEVGDDKIISTINEKDYMESEISL